MFLKKNIDINKNVETKVMNKQLVIIGIVALLVCVGFSGCTNNSSTPDITLPDGTKVTGDTGQIQIVNHQMVKKKYLQLHSTSDKSDYKSLFSEEVPYELNISDITFNFSKRKNICDSYFTTNYWIIWNNNYTGFTHTNGLPYHIDSFSSDNNVSAVIITGTAKNIGKEFMSSAIITINFYNAEGAWLASEKAFESNIPSGYTRDFNVDYRGEFRNNVNYISFEVKATSIG
jgi:hypothetical protein